MNGVGAVALEESDEFVCAALCGDSDAETCEVVPWSGAHSHHYCSVGGGPFREHGHAQVPVAACGREALQRLRRFRGVTVAQQIGNTASLDSTVTRHHPL